ncbi:peptide-methionine (R)-S-oxide reductase [Polymorphobacter multimanifer]|uniref:peptide-methionine (R)-S-oxide reductase n=1 Tax=Polymorphobacter multimanifer TaxID=1070431 RepID=A0A841L0J1_9SPHN|nr:peptide-methionine (R)-S-oxide reductase MsrB [Polymorphobacter multimanifer]MBB6226064.1 peptide-methionine (R)-S-oxide reductase [Polymorphobacter multimanifer]GGI83920.1 peptide-methionine (R)-S-oxide reductase [Polymorphobacter multimanifer]
MIHRRTFIAMAAAAAALPFIRRFADTPALAADTRAAKFSYTLSDEAWKKKLAPDAYQVLRHESTERPYTSPLNKEKRAGTFVCAGCELPLFSSTTKYESGTGWPSFWQPLKGAVGTETDKSIPFMVRTEVHCARCGGHLGHVFDDGPKPTGLRYCMNGVSLKFAPAKAA